MSVPGELLLRGIAPLVEFHYTTTLNNAQILSLPGDGLMGSDTSRIGNYNNRMDLVVMTAGAALALGPCGLLTGGFTFPLSDDNNRVFDWEAQLQLNIRFGGPGNCGLFNHR